MTKWEAIQNLEMENALMQFDPMTGEDRPIEFQNQDNKNLYEANIIAIKSLKKEKRFKKLKKFFHILNIKWVKGECKKPCILCKYRNECYDNLED